MVRIPRVQMLSLMPMGMPARAERDSPFSRFSSTSAAFFRASSSQTVRYAPISPSFALIRSKTDCVSSTLEHSFFAKSSDSFSAVS